MDSAAIRRRAGLGLAVLTGSGLLALAVPGTAQAASSTCPGREVKTLPFTTGTVHVYKRDGYVCALTTPDHPGRKQWMSVTVQARGNRAVTDKGRYSYHAGPVTVHAGHRCVRVSGAVASGSVASGWILC
ncbi:hypothetical protein ACF1B0_09560 [Streptomyces anandii]|uniref:hypothetical protein n=1 Tax=Streptomyces anandii TaxID=285454 RepID=UPI0016763F69|nr:hypothetical protein [Streptomyces anandii]GGX86377.1 hypothetical protein GCM10010510_34390 [Streptomyces anandii JCM 4720]